MVENWRIIEGYSSEMCQVQNNVESLSSKSCPHNLYLFICSIWICYSATEHQGWQDLSCSDPKAKFQAKIFQAHFGQFFPSKSLIVKV